MQCIGRPAGGQVWTVGIADPRRPGALLGAVPGRADGGDLAVASSGSAERGAHIVDPHGGPADELVAVTVVGRRLAVLDAYATAAFAMGARAGDWLRARQGISALLVHRDGRTETVTAGG